MEGRCDYFWGSVGGGQMCVWEVIELKVKFEFCWSVFIVTEWCQFLIKVLPSFLKHRMPTIKILMLNLQASLKSYHTSPSKFQQNCGCPLGRMRGE